MDTRINGETLNGSGKAVGEAIFQINPLTYPTPFKSRSDYFEKIFN